MLLAQQVLDCVEWEGVMQHAQLGDTQKIGHADISILAEANDSMQYAPCILILLPWIKTYSTVLIREIVERYTPTFQISRASGHLASTTAEQRLTGD